jgi:ferredoxin-NADP reductase
MNNYEARLIQSREVASGSMAFYFAKPSGFVFKAGQAINLDLNDPGSPGTEDLRHAFSIVSAPFEKELVVATRMRESAYKRALRALPPGSTANISGPFGSLALHQDRALPAVFIAGGIGITPFMSILRQAAQEQSPQHFLLLYSNRKPEEAAFLEELRHLSQGKMHFRLVATMTGMSMSSRPWIGERARIDAAFLKNAAGTLAEPIYYVAGPPAMVEAMRQVLSQMDVGDEAIRSEDFYGY